MKIQSMPLILQRVGGTRRKLLHRHARAYDSFTLAFASAQRASKTRSGFSPAFMHENAPGKRDIVCQQHTPESLALTTARALCTIYLEHGYRDHQIHLLLTDSAKAIILSTAVIRRLLSHAKHNRKCPSPSLPKMNPGVTEILCVLSSCSQNS